MPRGGPSIAVGIIHDVRIVARVVSGMDLANTVHRSNSGVDCIAVVELIAVYVSWEDHSVRSGECSRVGDERDIGVTVDGLAGLPTIYDLGHPVVRGRGIGARCSPRGGREGVETMGCAGRFTALGDPQGGAGRLYVWREAFTGRLDKARGGTSRHKTGLTDRLNELGGVTIRVKESSRPGTRTQARLGGTKCTLQEGVSRRSIGRVCGIRLVARVGNHAAHRRLGSPGTAGGNGLRH